MIIAAAFTGFNLGNVCDINFGFMRFEKVPVFLTILFSFLAGVLVTLPFTFGKRKAPAATKAEKKLFAKKEKQSKTEKSFGSETTDIDDELPFSDNKRS